MRLDVLVYIPSSAAPTWRSRVFIVAEDLSCSAAQH